MSQQTQTDTSTQGSPSERINILLGAEDVAFLDAEVRRIGPQLNRSAILRGLIGGFMRGGANFGSARDEQGIEVAVFRWLQLAAWARAQKASRQGVRKP